MSEREKGGAERNENEVRAAAFLALSAGLYWSWWDAFHEICRFLAYEVPTSPDAPFLEIGSGYLQCLMKPLGIGAGCALVLLFLWRGASLSFGSPEKRSEKGAAPGFRVVLLFAAQVIAWSLFCYTIELRSLFVPGIVYGIASALVAPVIVGVSLRLRGLDRRIAVCAIAGSVCCYGVFSNLAYPLFLQHAPVVVAFGLYLCVLIAAFALYVRASRACAMLATGGATQMLPPWQLAAHLVIYGCVFGVLHILEGLTATGPYSINVGVFLGCIIAALIFLFMFARAVGSGEIWSKMRSTVFPLVIIGYLLIPLASTSDVALSFTEAGGMLYLSILCYGCLALMDRTAVAGPAIVAWALLLYSVGEALGVVMAGSQGPSSWMEGDSYAMVSVAIVLALTAATFWVASDEQVRKLWGLRRDMSPRRFNDAIVAARVELLSERYSLTPREADVLRFVANGRRAPEMADEMGVSQDTVRTHLKHLYSKPSAHSYAEVARILKETEVADSDLRKHADSE